MFSLNSSTKNAIIGSDFGNLLERCCFVFFFFK
jgi:hypothetical protein